MHGTKLLLKRDDAKVPLIVPRYAEFSMEDLLKILESTPAMAYHPNPDHLGKKHPDRQFITILLSTFVREYFFDFINYTHELRVGVQDTGVLPKEIGISDELKKLLASVLIAAR